MTVELILYPSALTKYRVLSSVLPHSSSGCGLLLFVNDETDCYLVSTGIIYL